MEEVERKGKKRWEDAVEISGTMERGFTVLTVIECGGEPHENSSVASLKVGPRSRIDSRLPSSPSSQEKIWMPTSDFLGLVVWGDNQAPYTSALDPDTQLGGGGRRRPQMHLVPLQGAGQFTYKT